jgi:hypothetical protein
LTPGLVTINAIYNALIADAGASILNYEVWIVRATKDMLGVNYGLAILEEEITKIVIRRSANPDFELRYINTWGAMSLNASHPGNTDWASANPMYIIDLGHPNFTGFVVWGAVVGNRLRELNWISDKGVADTVYDDNVTTDEQSDREDDTGLSDLELALICYYTGNCHS